jgi:hypothetical protein
MFPTQGQLMSGIFAATGYVRLTSLRLKVASLPQPIVGAELLHWVTRHGDAAAQQVVQRILNRNTVASPSP